MSEMYHQPAKYLLVQAIALIAAVFVFTLAHAAQVNLAWDPNDPVPDGYRVYQRLESGAYDYSSPVWPGSGDNAQATTCTISNLADATTYYFVVRAYVGSDESGDSNEISFRYDPPAPQTYTLSVSAGANGTITPGTTTVDAGSSLTFSISPLAYYHIADVQVDGNSIGPVSSYTFNNILAAHSISASFAADIYTVSASAGAHGTISPSGTVNAVHGSSSNFTMTADAGYHVADVLVDGVSAGPLNTYTFYNISASHTIAAVFDINSYAISSTAGTGGTISPAGQIAVAAGSSQSFTLTANTGYVIQDLVVDGVSAGAQSTYTFLNIQSGHAIEASFAQSNQPPVADAGPDQLVDEAQMVTLSGTNSVDADDGIASFQWRQIQGAAVSLSGSGQEVASFQAPDVDMAGQALVFELTVTDYQGATSIDTCIVNVSWVNQVPTADAGGDQSVAEGSSVTLNAGASTDPDDGIAGYSWVQLAGPPVMLTAPQSAAPQFTAPDVGPQGASLIFEVTVTDAGGLKDTDRCNVIVTWENLAPVADAGADQTVPAGADVSLDGSLSSDPDGSTLLYQWRQTDGPPVTLSDATAAGPVFAAPAGNTNDIVLTFSLTVTDNGGLQGVDTCKVTVQGAPGPAPDTTAPLLTIENPVGDAVEVSSNKIDISGTAADDQQVDRIVWVNDRGQSGEALGTVSWRIDQMRLHRWRNTITISAYDTAGNSTSKTIIITLRSRR